MKFATFKGELDSSANTVTEEHPSLEQTLEA
jgi:hypothetical protein